MFFADSRGFLAPEGSPPLFIERPNLSIVHLTSVPSTSTRFVDALAAHKAFLSAVVFRNQGVVAIERVRDLEEIRDRLGVVFGMQHVPTDITTRGAVQVLGAEGLRFMSLRQVFPGEQGGGFEEVAGGLTPKGKQLLEWMAKHRISLDVSGMSYSTIQQSLAFIEQEGLSIIPMASSSGCGEVLASPGNLRYITLRWISRLGGYIGIPLLPQLLTDKDIPPHCALLEHVRYVAAVCGDETVGIGSGRVHNADQGPRILKELEGELRGTLPGEIEGLYGANFRSYLSRILPP